MRPASSQVDPAQLRRRVLDALDLLWLPARPVEELGPLLETAHQHPSTLKRSGSSSNKSAPTSPPAGGARSGYALESAQISAAIRVPCPPLHEGPGRYAHKVTVDRAYGGQGLGAELLDWAGTKAADEGAGWLRVDVWTTNERLQHYYLRQGFTYVRTVVLPHNPSGALFQRPAQHVPTPRLHEDRAAAEPPPRS